MNSLALIIKIKNKGLFQLTVAKSVGSISNVFSSVILTKSKIRRTINNVVYLRERNTGEIIKFDWNRLMWNNQKKMIVYALKTDYVVNDSHSLKILEDKGVMYAIDGSGKKASAIHSFLFYKTVSRFISLQNPITKKGFVIRVGRKARLRDKKVIKVFLEEGYKPMTDIDKRKIGKTIDVDKYFKSKEIKTLK